MILYFQENDGDYLAIDTTTNSYYLSNFAQDHFEGRATAIGGVLCSVCTTGIAREFLRTNCKRVAKATVPQEWRKAIGLGGSDV